MKFAEVVFNLPIDIVFHYRIPDGLQSKVKVGLRSWVQFGTRRLVGYIVGLTDTSEAKRIKDIEALIDEEPILSSCMPLLSKWISEYYCCSWRDQIAAPI